MSKPRSLRKRLSDSQIAVRAAPFKLSWSANEPPIVKEYQTVEEFVKSIEAAEQQSPHECFWHRSIQQTLHTTNSSNLRRWKLVQNQISFLVYRRAFGDQPLSAVMIISSSCLVLFASDSEMGDASTIAGWFHSTLKERSLLNFAERLDIVGSASVVSEYLKLCTTKDAATQKRVITLGGPISEHKYRKEVSNSQRVFYISPKHLSKEPRSKAQSEYTALLTPGALRLARAEEIAQIRKIFHASNGAGEDDSDSDDDEEDDNLDELVKKDRVWIWTRDGEARGTAGRTIIKADIECFAILQYHDTPTNVENSTLELVDIHLRDPEEGLKYARALIDGLCDHYLRHTEKRQPYRFFYVNVDSGIPESSDDFLLDCGFQYDSTIDMVTLVSSKATTPTSSSGSGGLSDVISKTPTLPHFSLPDTVTVASSTEKPFTAFTVRDNTTGETTLKRYREFDRLYGRLKTALPKANLPKPPKKKLFGNLDTDFVERRRRKLEQWMNAIAEVPGVEDTALLVDFMASQLQRRGIKQTEEDHLLEILKRANDKPVQIVDKAPEHIYLQRGQVTHTTPTSSSRDIDSSSDHSDSIAAVHTSRSTPSLVQAADSIFGTKKPSQPVVLTTHTMPNLNAVATIGTAMTSPRATTSSRDDKSPRREKPPSSSSSSDPNASVKSPRKETSKTGESPRRHKAPKSHSEYHGHSSTRPRHHHHRDRDKDKEKDKESGHSSSDSKPRTHRSHGHHHHRRDEHGERKPRPPTDRTRPSGTLRMSRESPI